MFDSKAVKQDVVNWIRCWFDENGRGCKAVVGISGGKDSSVVAALCCEALGNDNVIGVLMPNGNQADINDSIAVCEFLSINYICVNIKDAYNAILNQLSTNTVFGTGSKKK